MSGIREGAGSSSGSGASEQDFLTPDGQYRIESNEIGLLGSGAHGVVRIGQHIQTLEYVAVKITPLSVIRSSCKEMTALSRLSSPHIVQLLSVQVDMDQDRVYLIVELCQGGELFDRIAECGGLTEDEARRYFAQILSALRHCHQNGVYHRDLKPENILLDDDDNAKVADFGLAAVYRHVHADASFLQHTKVGSMMYAAPEVLISTAMTGYDAARADMWSLGIILFSMLSGTLPFECAAASRCKRYAAVLRQGIQVMCPENLSSQVTSLLARLLHPDPNQRFTTEQALQCEWLRDASNALTLGVRDELPPPRSWAIIFRLVDHHIASLPAVESSTCDSASSAMTSSVTNHPASESMVATSAEASARDAEVLQPSQKRKLEGELASNIQQRQRHEEPPLQQQPRVVDASCEYRTAPESLATHRGSADSSSLSETALTTPIVPDEQSEGSVPSAIPLGGCLSQIVRVWGWEPLPRGTEQLLREIFQTLHTLGMRYTLQEQQGDAADGEGNGPGCSPASGRKHRMLILQINFDAECSSTGGVIAHPPL
mmetsp:Transcript_26324/g.43705  ORF Transcript_26324/g.43705 Transcript_26324/m.43705 type:complete len:545 (+) Transcript_26324:148-1782(+)|eukprot:CAMPEP_0119327074 /NCGR_PEP_ID=MMETSP1333-20130426/69849_1 /TAXON_ID=418940 /ORGANISM="Scyphosphaera apsteinii, Strain RCC1455" /LENGTH=544 /DNA_ID=CAMNT_0007335553 /DNA_START=148 /DNA_END=1782 /DNA_ORIENTATION=-